MKTPVPNMNDPSAHEEALFEAAQKLTKPAQRKAFLDAACAEDPALRRRMDELFAAQQEAEPFFREGVDGLMPPDRSTESPDVTCLNPDLSEGPGVTIGRYKLLQKIGEGGCGVVYMAEQEEPVKRRVALKVIKLGMDTKSVIARFEAERQALAMMDHPNIAKVLDAGATDTGRPYFVMELVRGVKITEYCDEVKLPTLARLELFTRVCQAIQHAHQKGIMHRDIKPSNILVTVNDGAPVPKVIDFGIAKATTGQQLTDKTLFTAFEQFIGTPAYMSPEQAVMTSLDIDTRSDIYALGVLLYELLTGKTPFDPKELLAAGFDEMRRTIREKEPARPSTRVSSMPGEELSTTAHRRGLEAPNLANVLRGDLDWIVMKCLEKDRTRRYETATGLAMDLQRFIAHEPVIARPPSTLYRFQKWTQRNRLVFGAMAAVFGALALGVIVSTILAIKARHAQTAADEQRGQAEQNARTAEEQSSLAKTKEQQALASEAQMRRTVYAAEMNQAAQAIENANFRQARTLLAKWVPTTNSTSTEDLRDFTWRLLKRQSRGDQAFSLNTKGRPLTDLRLSPDGRCLAIESKEEAAQTDFWDFERRQLIVSLTNAVIYGWNISNQQALIGTNQDKVGWYDPWTQSYQHIVDVRSTNKNVSVYVYYDPALHPFIRIVASSEATLTWEEFIFDLETGRKLPASVNDLPVPKEYQGAISQLTAKGEQWLYPHPFFGSGFHPGKRWAVFQRGALQIPLHLAVWDREKRAFVREFDASFFKFAIQESCSLLATLPLNSRKEPITIFDLASDGEPVRLASTDPSSSTWAIELSPNGRFLASAGSDGAIRLWDPATGRPVRRLRGHDGPARFCAFSRDSRWLVSGDDSGRVLIWRMDTNASPRDEVTGLPVSRAVVFGPRFHAQMVFSPDGKRVAAKLISSETAVWDAADLREVTRFPEGGQVLAFAEDSTALYVLHDDRVARWDIESRSSRVLLQESDGFSASTTNEPYISGAISSDGRRLVEWSWARGLRLWDLPSRRILHEEGALPQSAFKSIAMSKDIFATGDAFHREIRLWNTATGAPQGEFNAAFTGGDATDGVAGLGFSPDGRFLACGAGRGLVKIFDVNRDEPLLVLRGHRQNVNTVAFSPDGKTLASAGSDGAIHFWSAADGQQLAAIPFSDADQLRTDDTVRWLTFAPDGSCLAGLSNDGTLRLFRAASLKEIDNHE